MFTNINVGHTQDGLIYLVAFLGSTRYSWFINSIEWNRFMCSRNVNDIKNTFNRDILEKLLLQISSKY